MNKKGDIFLVFVVIAHIFIVLCCIIRRLNNPDEYGVSAG